MIPMWLHPDVAGHVLRHFGRDGRAVVHPHPTLNIAKGYAQGGVAFPAIRGSGTVGSQLGAAPAMAMPAHMGGAGGMGTFPSAVGAPANVGRTLGGIRGRAPQSIFSGGATGPPIDRTPFFAQNGAVLNGIQGVGRVPGVDTGEDTQPAVLRPGELVATPEQQEAIQIKPGKAHLLRADQRKAIKAAAKRK